MNFIAVGVEIARLGADPLAQKCHRRQQRGAFKKRAATGNLLDAVRLVFPVSNIGARFYQRTISERARVRRQVEAGLAWAGGKGLPAR